MVNTTNIILLIAIIVVTGYFYFDMQKTQTYLLTDFQEVDFETSSLQELLNSYNTNEEYLACAYGEIVGKTIMVNNIEFSSDIIRAGDDLIEANCDEPLFGSKLIGTLHNHPSGLCQLSPQDFLTFGRSKHAFTGVICSPNKLVVYTNNNLIGGFPKTHY